MVVLAVMFTAVWLRSREPGTWLLAIGFAVASGWYFLSPRAPNTGADIDTLAERVSAAAVGVAILLRAIGVALYLGWSAGWMRRFVLLCCLPALASIAWLAVGGVLAALTPPPKLHEVPSPVFNVILAAAHAAGFALDFNEAAVARMRSDLVFDPADAQRDFGYAPRGFHPTAAMYPQSD